MKQKFQATITGRGPNSAWTQLDIPFNVHEVFGAKGMVPVTGTLNGVPFRNSLKPNGDGTHYLHVNQALLAGAKVRVGDTVALVIERDEAPRTVEIPEDLQSALAAASKGAAKASLAQRFAALSYSHQKEFVDWLEQARKPETRTRRLAKTLELLAAKKTPKG